MERVRDLDRLVWIGFWTASVIVALDIVLKQIAIRLLSSGDQHWMITGWIGLDLTSNRRFAFGLGPDGLAASIIPIAALAILGLIIARKLVERSPLTTIAIGLIVGGAVANLLDRLRDNAVTDFVAIGPWPRFNLADSALTIGVGILIFADITSADGRPV